jgi:putative inorganic carbon (hco3(-)) transporter
LFGPYVDTVNAFRYYNSSEVFLEFNKGFLLFYLAIMVIDDNRKVKLFSCVIICVVIILAIWTNDQYLSKAQFGRIHGPSAPEGGGIYYDENSFGTIFVVGIPYLYYAAQYVKNFVLRGALWSFIGLAWHSIFLTGSRGAAIGLLAIVIGILIKSSKKRVAFLFAAFAVLAFIWQGGDLLKDRLSTIGDYGQEESASTRLEAWETAINMIIAYPLTGVGVASFGQAFPDFSHYQPRIAHNTLLQIAAEMGIFAGFIYFYLNIYLIVKLWKISKSLNLSLKDASPIYFLSEATIVSTIGYITCSMFLSLERYEIFYYLCVIGNAIENYKEEEQKNT